MAVSLFFFCHSNWSVVESEEDLDIRMQYAKKKGRTAGVSAVVLCCCIVLLGCYNLLSFSLSCCGVLDCGAAAG